MDHLVGSVRQIENFTKREVLSKANHAGQSSGDVDAELSNQVTQAIDQLHPLANQKVAHDAAIATPAVGYVMTATKRMVGRVTASQMASLSMASDLTRLTYGFTYIGGINQTSWPRAMSSRAQ